MAVDKFHIKKQEYSNRTLRFPVELLEELNTIATSKNISLNQLVVKCCEYAMNNIDDEETGEQSSFLFFCQITNYKNAHKITNEITKSNNYLLGKFL